MISGFLKFFRTESCKISRKNIFAFTELHECGLARGSITGIHKNFEIKNPLRKDTHIFKNKVLSTNKVLLTSTSPFKIVITETLTIPLSVTTEIQTYVEKPYNNRNATRVT